MDRFQQILPAQIRRNGRGSGIGDGNELKHVEPIQPRQHFHLKSAEGTIPVVQKNVFAQVRLHELPRIMS